MGCIRSRNDVIKICYPIILKVLQRFGNIFDTQNRIFDHKDLLSECVFIVIRCADNFDMTKKIKFSTYLWHSLYRGMARFVTENMTSISKRSTNLYEYDEGRDEFIMRQDLDSLGIDYEIETEKMEDLLNHFSEEEKLIIAYRLDEKEPSYICKELNLTPTQYKIKLNNIKFRLDGELYD